jgi:hypothetical protein
MIKLALAGALALAAVGVLPASADPQRISSQVAAGAALTESHIAQAKAALRLTPAQERHWPRVAAALRAFARQGNGAASQINGARRVISAARPLLRSLDAEQKQAAMMMVRSLGFGHLASAL